MKQTLQLKLIPAPHPDAAAAAVDPAAAAVDARAQCRGRAHAAGEPAARAEEGEDEAPPQEVPLAGTAPRSRHHRAPHAAKTTATATATGMTAVDSTSTQRRPARRHRLRRLRRRRRRRLGRRQRQRGRRLLLRSRSRRRSLRDHLIEQLALAQPAAARPAGRRRADRRARRRRLPHVVARGDRRDVPGGDALDPTSSRSASSTCRASSRPASARATAPSACALQLKTLPDDTPFRTEALKVVDGHLPLLAARDFTKLRACCICDEAGVRGVRELVRSLNPRPGASFAKDRGELRHSRRRRAQGARPVGRVAQRGGDAEAAAQPHLRRHPDAQPRRRRTSSSQRSCRKRSG